jgi:hypothetical protein
MSRQNGLTMTGFLVTAVILVIIALLGFQIAPPYMEYYTIKKQIKLVANEFQGAPINRNAVVNAFVRRATVENITAVNPEDLEITKEGDKVTLTMEYSVKVPLIKNLSACMDFKASSD